MIETLQNQEPVHGHQGIGANEASDRVAPALFVITRSGAAKRSRYGRTSRYGDFDTNPLEARCASRAAALPIVTVPFTALMVTGLLMVSVSGESLSSVSPLILMAPPLATEFTASRSEL